MNLLKKFLLVTLLAFGATCAEGMTPRRKGCISKIWEFFGYKEQGVPQKTAQISKSIAVQKNQESHNKSQEEIEAEEKEAEKKEAFLHSLLLHVFMMNEMPE